MEKYIILSKGNVERYESLQAAAAASKSACEMHGGQVGVYELVGMHCAKTVTSVDWLSGDMMSSGVKVTTTVRECLETMPNVWFSAAVRYFTSEELQRPCAVLCNALYYMLDKNTDEGVVAWAQVLKAAMAGTPFPRYHARPLPDDMPEPSEEFAYWGERVVRRDYGGNAAILDIACLLKPENIWQTGKTGLSMHTHYAIRIGSPTAFENGIGEPSQ